MKLYIDSADYDEIEKALDLGCDGVTTNPSLMKASIEKSMGESKDKGESKKKMEEYILKILDKAGKDRPVSLEVISLTEEEMLKEARLLYSKFNKFGNLVIKVPINTEFDGSPGSYDAALKVIKQLSEEGIPVNCTVVMDPEQALMAAKAGAKYISPFAGRIDDHIRAKILEWKVVKKDPEEKEFTKQSYFPKEGFCKGEEQIVYYGVVSGVQLVNQCAKILKNYGFQTEVIAASVRNARQVRDLALLDSKPEISTIPFSVLHDMLYHEKTAEGVKKFAADVVPEYKAVFEN